MTLRGDGLTQTDRPHIPVEFFSAESWLREILRDSLADLLASYLRARDAVARGRADCGVDLLGEPEFAVWQAAFDALGDARGARA